MKAFAGKTILITGGGSGIGSEVATRFAAEGARVLIGDLNSEDAETLAARLRSEGGLAEAAALDVTDPFSVQDFVALSGESHALVNCAGIREIKPVLELDFAEWRRVIDVNLTGTFLMSQAFARKAVAAGLAGSIVNIASVAGFSAPRNRAAYVSSKHGVVGLTKEMALELGKHEIRVNLVAPGVIQTPMTESYFTDPDTIRRIASTHALGRHGMPADVAAAVLFLSSEAAGFITGATLAVDGGYLVGK